MDTAVRTWDGRLASHTSVGKNLTENQRWEKDLKSPWEKARNESYSPTLEKERQAALGVLLNRDCAPQS